MAHSVKCLSYRHENVSSKLQHPWKNRVYWLTSVALTMGKWIPKACWPASLAESISFRLMKEAVSQKQAEEQSRKATDIDLWPLHAQHICACVPLLSCTHTHMNVYMCHMKNTNNKKNQQEGKQLELARSHRCLQQNRKWMPDGPVQGPLPQFRSGCSCFPGTWHFSSVSCFIFQIFVNRYSRKEKSVNFTLSWVWYNLFFFFFKNKGSEWIYEI